MESLMCNLPPCAHAQSNWVTKIIRIMIPYGLPAEQVLFLAFGLHFPWFYWQNLSEHIGTRGRFPPPLHAYHAVTRQPASASVQHSGIPLGGVLRMSTASSLKGSSYAHPILYSFWWRSESFHRLCLSAVTCAWLTMSVWREPPDQNAVFVGFTLQRLLGAVPSLITKGGLGWIVQTKASESWCSSSSVRPPQSRCVTCTLAFSPLMNACKQDTERPVIVLVYYNWVCVWGHECVTVWYSSLCAVDWIRCTSGRR